MGKPTGVDSEQTMVQANSPRAEINHTGNYIHIERLRRYSITRYRTLREDFNSLNLVEEQVIVQQEMIS